VDPGRTLNNLTLNNNILEMMKRRKKKTEAVLSLTEVPFDCLGVILEHLDQSQIPSLRLVCRLFNACFNIGTPIFNYWFTKEFLGFVKSVKKLNLEGTGIQFKLSGKVQKMGPIIRKTVLGFAYRHPLFCRECAIIKRVVDRLEDEPKCGASMIPRPTPCREWDDESSKVDRPRVSDVPVELGTLMEMTRRRRVFMEKFRGFGKFDYLKSMSKELFKNRTTFNSKLSKYFITLFNFIFRTNVPGQMIQIYFTKPAVPEKTVAVYLLTSRSTQSKKSGVQQFWVGKDMKRPERRKVMVPSSFRLKFKQFEFLYRIGCKPESERNVGICLKCRTWYDIRIRIRPEYIRVQCNICRNYSLCRDCPNLKTCSGCYRVQICGLCISKVVGFSKTICGEYLCMRCVEVPTHNRTYMLKCKYCKRYWCGNNWCKDIKVHFCDGCEQIFCSSCIVKYKKNWTPPLCSSVCGRRTICKECWSKRIEPNQKTCTIFALMCEQCTARRFKLGKDRVYAAGNRIFCW